VWTYTLDNNNATVQALNVARAPLADSFTVHTVDNTPQLVTVAINGADDAPTLNHDTGATVVQGADIAIAVIQRDFDDLDNADARQWTRTPSARATAQPDLRRLRQRHDPHRLGQRYDLGQRRQRHLGRRRRRRSLRVRCRLRQRPAQRLRLRRG
jgi:hypothetical protein